MGRFARIKEQWLEAPTHLASLAFFRIVLGLILAIEAIAEWALGFVTEYAIEPDFHFSYPGFEWVKPLPGWGMHAVHGLILAGALGFAAGAWFRVSALILWFCYTWQFLIDSAWYLNHHYLIVLLLGLFVLSPAGKYASWDAKRSPSSRATHAPAFWRTVFLAMLTIVYFYAGLAKLNVDWLRCEPMRTWLSEGEATFIAGEWLKSEWVAGFLSYGGLMFDLCVPWLLLWGRTRKIAFGMVLFFHFSNFLLFEIGVFPWTMLAATTLFFQPNWPLRFWPKRGRGIESSTLPSVSPILRWAIAIFILFQVLFPFRHFLVRGDVSWTEQGHRFSWHMMLRSKTGSAYFMLENPRTGFVKKVSAAARLHKWQYRKMAVHPEMIWQYGQFLGQEIMQEKGWDTVAVRVEGLVSLNGREPSPLIDPDRDIWPIQLGWGAYDWVTAFPPLRQIKVVDVPINP